MKKCKKIMLFISLFCICDVVLAAGNSFSSNTYYSNVCGTNFIPVRIPNFISSVYSIIKSAVPIVIILVGSFDFFKAMMSDKSKDGAKYTSNFIRRIVAGIIIFFVLSIVKFIFTMVGPSSDYMTCLNCLINNDGCGATYVVEKKTCEMYKSSNCPSDVDGMQCQKIDTPAKKVCRTVCSSLTEKNSCNSRGYCTWKNNSCTDYEFTQTYINVDRSRFSQTNNLSPGNTNIVSIARRYIGKFPYSMSYPRDPDVDGTTDCSGFTWYVYKKAGITVPATPWDTVSMESDAKNSHKYLIQIDPSQSKAGDLVCGNKGTGAGSNGHAAVLLEKYHGVGTGIIEEGGTSRNVSEGAVRSGSVLSGAGGARVTIMRPVQSNR